MVKIIASEGGDIFKFAGDAMIILWPESAGSMEQRARHAVQCAESVQRALHEAKLEEDVTLSVKIGVGVGNVSILHLGGELGRMEYVAIGDPLVQAFAAEEHCQAGGEVLVSPAVWALVKEHIRPLEVLKDGFARITEHGKGVAEGVVISRMPRRGKGGVGIELQLAGAAAEARLKQYTAGAIQAWISPDVLELESWGGDLRNVSVLFVNLGLRNDDLLAAAKYEEPMRRVHEVLRAVQRSVYRFEGSVNKFLMDDKGSTLIAVFGLPPISHHDDATRAVLAALAVCDELWDLELQASVGVTTGVVFCGVVGSTTRKEYSVLGDTVNLSARLMQRAMKTGGGVIVDSQIVSAVGPEVEFADLGEITVKGKSNLIRVSRPYPAASLDEGLPLRGRPANYPGTEPKLFKAAFGRQLRRVAEHRRLRPADLTVPPPDEAVAQPGEGPAGGSAAAGADGATPALAASALGPASPASAASPGSRGAGGAAAASSAAPAGAAAAGGAGPAGAALLPPGATVLKFRTVAQPPPVAPPQGVAVAPLWERPSLRSATLARVHQLELTVAPALPSHAAAVAQAASSASGDDGPGVRALGRACAGSGSVRADHGAAAAAVASGPVSLSASATPTLASVRDACVDAARAAGVLPCGPGGEARHADYAVELGGGERRWLLPASRSVPLPLLSWLVSESECVPASAMASGSIPARLIPARDVPLRFSSHHRARMALLNARIALFGAGQGGCVLLEGDAGSGKTRTLARAVGEDMVGKTAVLTVAADPFDRFNALKPLVEAASILLRERVIWAREAAGEAGPAAAGAGGAAAAAASPGGGGSPGTDSASSGKGGRPAGLAIRAAAGAAPDAARARDAAGRPAVSRSELTAACLAALEEAGVDAERTSRCGAVLNDPLGVRLPSTPASKLLCRSPALASQRAALRAELLSAVVAAHCGGGVDAGAAAAACAPAPWASASSSDTGSSARRDSARKPRPAPGAARPDSQPLLLVVDDAQFLHPDAWDALARLAGRASLPAGSPGSLPLLLVLATRPPRRYTDVIFRTVPHGYLDLAASPHCEHVVLGRLWPRDAMALAALALEWGGPIRDDVFAIVQHRSGGRPAAVVELLRLLLARGRIIVLAEGDATARGAESPGVEHGFSAVVPCLPDALPKWRRRTRALALAAAPARVRVPYLRRTHDTLGAQADRLAPLPQLVLRTAAVVSHAARSRLRGRVAPLSAAQREALAVGLRASEGEDAGVPSAGAEAGGLSIDDARTLALAAAAGIDPQSVAGDEASWPAAATVDFGVLCDCFPFPAPREALAAECRRLVTLGVLRETAPSPAAARAAAVGSAASGAGAGGTDPPHHPAPSSPLAASLLFRFAHPAFAETVRLRLLDEQRAKVLKKLDAAVERRARSIAGKVLSAVLRSSGRVVVEARVRKSTNKQGRVAMRSMRGEWKQRLLCVSADAVEMGKPPSAAQAGLLATTDMPVPWRAEPGDVTQRIPIEAAEAAVPAADELGAAAAADSGFPVRVRASRWEKKGAAMPEPKNFYLEVASAAARQQLIFAVNFLSERARAAARRAGPGARRAAGGAPGSKASRVGGGGIAARFGSLPWPAGTSTAAPASRLGGEPVPRLGLDDGGRSRVGDALQVCVEGARGLWAADGSNPVVDLWVVRPLPRWAAVRAIGSSELLPGEALQELAPRLAAAGGFGGSGGGGAASPKATPPMLGAASGRSEPSQRRMSSSPGGLAGAMDAGPLSLGLGVTASPLTGARSKSHAVRADAGPGLPAGPLDHVWAAALEPARRVRASGARTACGIPLSPSQAAAGWLVACVREESGCGAESVLGYAVVPLASLDADASLPEDDDDGTCNDGSSSPSAEQAEVSSAQRAREAAAAAVLGASSAGQSPAEAAPRHDAGRLSALLRREVGAEVGAPLVSAEDAARAVLGGAAGLAAAARAVLGDAAVAAAIAAAEGGAEAFADALGSDPLVDALDPDSVPAALGGRLPIAPAQPGADSAGLGALRLRLRLAVTPRCGERMGVTRAALGLAAASFAGMEPLDEPDDRADAEGEARFAASAATALPVMELPGAEAAPSPSRARGSLSRTASGIPAAAHPAAVTELAAGLAREAWASAATRRPLAVVVPAELLALLGAGESPASVRCAGGHWWLALGSGEACVSPWRADGVRHVVDWAVACADRSLAARSSRRGRGLFLVGGGAGGGDDAGSVGREAWSTPGGGGNPAGRALRHTSVGSADGDDLIGTSAGEAIAGVREAFMALGGSVAEMTVDSDGSEFGFSDEDDDASDGAESGRAGLMLGRREAAAVRSALRRAARELARSGGSGSGGSRVGAPGPASYGGAGAGGGSAGGGQGQVIGPGGARLRRINSSPRPVAHEWSGEDVTTGVVRGRANGSPSSMGKHEAAGGMVVGGSRRHSTPPGLAADLESLRVGGDRMPVLMEAAADDGGAAGDAAAVPHALVVCVDWNGAPLASRVMSQPGYLLRGRPAPGEAASPGRCGWGLVGLPQLPAARRGAAAPSPAEDDEDAEFDSGGNGEGADPWDEVFLEVTDQEGLQGPFAAASVLDWYLDEAPGMLVLIGPGEGSWEVLSDAEPKLRVREWCQATAAAVEGACADPWSWRFSLFRGAGVASPGRALALAAYVWSALRIPRFVGATEAALVAFVRAVGADHADGAAPGGPRFHSLYRAVDGAHAAAVALASWGGASLLTANECAALVAAVLGRDAGHPGRTEAHLAATEHELALRYSDDAVLERHSAARCAQAAREAGMWDCLDAPARTEVRRLVGQLVLATDPAAVRPVLASARAVVAAGFRVVDAQRDGRCPAGARVLAWAAKGNDHVAADAERAVAASWGTAGPARAGIRAPTALPRAEVTDSAARLSGVRASRGGSGLNDAGGASLCLPAAARRSLARLLVAAVDAAAPWSRGRAAARMWAGRLVMELRDEAKEAEAAGAGDGAGPAADSMAPAAAAADGLAAPLLAGLCAVLPGATEAVRGLVRARSAWSEAGPPPEWLPGLAQAAAGEAEAGVMGRARFAAMSVGAGWAADPEDGMDSDEDEGESDDDSIAWPEAAAPAPEAASAPDEEWTAFADEDGDLYFLSSVTGESQWERPPGFTGEPANV